METFVAVIRAVWTIAPVGSVMVPAMEAVWAFMRGEIPRIRSTSKTNFLRVMAAPSIPKYEQHASVTLA